MLVKEFPNPIKKSCIYQKRKKFLKILNISFNINTYKNVIFL